MAATSPKALMLQGAPMTEMHLADYFGSVSTAVIEEAAKNFSACSLHMSDKSIAGLAHFTHRQQPIPGRIAISQRQQYNRPQTALVQT